MPMNSHFIKKKKIPIVMEYVGKFFHGKKIN